MKMNHILFAVLATATVFVSATETNSISESRFYERLVKREQIGVVREYTTRELMNNPKILETRGDDLIIERCIGKVTTKAKDGRILNTDDPVYNYISYKSVKEARKGDVILTLFIYNPGNGDCDDIVDRFDYIIDSKNSKRK